MNVRIQRAVLALAILTGIIQSTSASSIIASDSWNDVVANDPYWGPYIKTTGHASLHATLPMESDIGSFDESTPYDIKIGGLELMGSLGGDPSYRKGKTSATFRQINYSTGTVVATVTVSWTPKNFTVVGYASYDAFYAESVYGGSTGPISDTLEATIQFGDTYLDVPIYIAGHNTDVPNDDVGDLNSGSITAQADFTVPTVTISSPAVNLSSTNPVISVTGTAADNISLAGVFWRWASASDDPRLWRYYEWQNVDSVNLVGNPSKSGTWSVAPNMSGNGPGTNRFWVMSTDSSYNGSAVATRNFFYSVRSLLTLSTNGPGGITGAKGVTNGAQLEIGRSYTVTAKALGTSNIFLNWTDADGNVLSPNATLNFVMQDSLTLRANFGPNPFPAIAGTYTGLFFDTYNGVSVDTAGYVSITTTKTGSYTGTLLLGANRYPVSGELLFTYDSTDADGTFVIKRGTLSPVTGYLFVPSNPAGGLSNLITGGIQIFDPLQDQWTLPSFSLAQSGYAPGVESGLYNLQIPGSTGSGQDGPIGNGYGTATVSAKGAVSLLLHVADGNVAPVSFSGSLAADGSFPFFIPLYAGKGLVTGWLNFTNEINDDVRGENITWIKLANSANKFYPDGFDRTMEVTGSHYVAPKTGTNIVNWTNGVFDFADSNMVGEVSVTFNPKNNTFSIDPGQTSTISKASFSFVPTTGTLNGSFTPAGGKSFTFGTLLMSKASNACGFFLDANQSGLILLRPAP